MISQDSRFSSNIVDDNDKIVAYKINRVYQEYSSILNELNKLHKLLESGAEKKEQTSKLTEKLLLNYRTFTRIKKFLNELVKIRNLYPSNKLIKKHIIYFENILYPLQTGDIVDFNITVNTNYGNLIEKLLRITNKQDKLRSRSKSRLKSISKSRSKSRSRSRSRSYGGKKKTHKTRLFR